MMKIKRLAFRIWVFAESHNAAIWFVIGLAVAFKFVGQAFSIAERQNWERQTVYTTAFDIGGIYTAFLFAFYTYSISSNSDFFAKARTTQAFKKMLKFVKDAIVIGFFMTAASVPLMIGNPSPDSIYSLSGAIVSIWFALVCSSLAAFWRATRVFWIFARTAE